METAQGEGTGDWAEAYKRAGKLVSHMALEEMNNVTLGYSSVPNGRSGNSGSVQCQQPVLNYAALLV
jgi:hypothetical protein